MTSSASSHCLTRIQRMLNNQLDINLKDRLVRRLSEPLPGRPAQQLFSHELSYGRHFGPVLRQSRLAAVLVLLRWDGERWLLPMTKRTRGGVHSGQICFAGGGLEFGETPVEAALRECMEETGWSPRCSEVLGTMSPLYVYASNNFVNVIVAATCSNPDWHPDKREVAELIEVPLQAICADDATHYTTIDRLGYQSRARCFRWQQHSIWGATSMILSELKSIILS